MSSYFPRRWYVMAVLVVLGVSAIWLQSSERASADYTSSFMGDHVHVPTGIYGSWGTIGTTNPYADSSKSFEFIMTFNRDANGVQHFVQIGWSKQPFCGPNPTVFWEWFDGTNYNNDSDKCDVWFPQGNNDYATQYDPSKGIWCWDYNGRCIDSRTSTYPKLTEAYDVAAYGETGNPVADMGGIGESNAIYISNLRYFNLSGNPVWIKYTSGAYGTGCYVPPGGTCRYGDGDGYAATVLYTFNWTKN